MGKEVVGREELCSATGEFEILGIGVLGAAANVDVAFGTRGALPTGVR